MLYIPGCPQLLQVSVTDLLPLRRALDEVAVPRPMNLAHQLSSRCGAHIDILLDAPLYLTRPPQIPVATLHRRQRPRSSRISAGSNMIRPMMIFQQLERISSADNRCYSAIRTKDSTVSNRNSAATICARHPSQYIHRPIQFVCLSCYFSS